jgi:hypothetical protein
MTASSEENNATTLALAKKHARIGWWSLLFFLSLGMLLEIMHGLKIGWYLDTGNHTRRFMWTLGHTHGTLLSLVHIAFAVSLKIFSLVGKRPLEIASTCLSLATILMPGGFILGGLFFYGGQPGIGVLLVPVGGLLLFAAVLLTARALQSD